MNAPTTETAARQPARELARILHECSDLAVHRLSSSFAQILDRVSELLMERASKTDVREEQQLFLDARDSLKTERPVLMSEFEKHLRKLIDERIAGKSAQKPDYSKVDASNMTLVETVSMDEAVLRGNIQRVVENLCHDELTSLNRGVGYLLGRPDLVTETNPLGPASVVGAFAGAVGSLKADRRIRFQILKDLNQAQLSDIAMVYSDLNKHLTRLNMMPGPGRHSVIQRGTSGERPPPRAPTKPPPPAGAPGAEVDVMAMFKRMYGSATPAAQAPPSPFGTVPSAPSFPGMPMIASGAQDGELPVISMPGPHAPAHAFAPMRPTPSGYVPGAPIISTADLHEGLTRLQAGQTEFDVGGAAVAFSGIPQGLHNVLRDLQESPLGAKANQLESMTIEMVAMLFDFIFETKDLPDGIKALLARLQIPVLKAAMLDGAFFAKKSHPSRLLVNELAQAGLGWSPVMGPEDPLYRKIDGIVHQILDNFSDDLAIFDEQRGELEAFLAEEERAAEENIQSSADEINQKDRLQIATVVAKAEIEKRIEGSPVPNFLASFLRQNWQRTLEQVYLDHGEESESWSSGMTTLEDLVWSVQPKRSPDDRRHLVALLPSLLKRLSAGMHNRTWPAGEREAFMSNLVEAHAAAVKPSLAQTASPTSAVAEAAKAQAEIAKASGDQMLAAKAEALAVAMTQAEPEPVEPPREVIDDDYLEIARSLERGMWIEFEADDGQLAFAKLAWVSPLRGTYLFTNRQGQKALSMTAEELAERFRADRARLVEAEPLIDRAFTSMMTQLEEKFPETATVH
ncbi:MAG: DUF1631 domain-containing protein [Burkholderiales bacterium]|nr:DUF1631 domain-containing protein [Burkholderiales bacterium]